MKKVGFKMCQILVALVCLTCLASCNKPKPKHLLEYKFSASKAGFNVAYEDEFGETVKLYNESSFLKIEFESKAWNQVVAAAQSLRPDVEMKITVLYEGKEIGENSACGDMVYVRTVATTPFIN